MTCYIITDESDLMVHSLTSATEQYIDLKSLYQPHFSLLEQSLIKFYKLLLYKYILLFRSLESVPFSFSFLNEINTFIL